MDRLRLLSELQSIDLRLANATRAQLELEARIADHSTVERARGELDRAQVAANDLRSRQLALELEVKGFDEHLRAVDSRLYGGKVTNPKELSGMERDEVMLRRQKSEVEDRILDMMSDLETAEATVKQRQAALDRAVQDEAVSDGQDRVRLSDLEKDARQLNAQREGLRSQIDPADLAIYDELLRTKKGRAVATLKGESCSICGSGIPSGVASRARMGNLAYCPDCGRIIVA